MQIRIKTQYCNEVINLRFGHYQNGSVAIQGDSLDGQPLFVATVALDEKPPENHIFLKGWSENKGIPEALVKAGIVELTGRTVPTGYVKALEAKLLLVNL
jgi:hypothetical protein